MTRISESMIRRRAEHNEYMLSTLEEVALHQQNIEKIELIGRLCPKLKILYLQNNLIGKIENLHKLKDLEYLNLALNNITKVQNLQRCESLQKLDLTVNFIPKAGLLSLTSLAGNYRLRELYLTGNPCTDWEGYRPYVLATLTQLQWLDGQEVRPSERIAAQQLLPELQQRLQQELEAEGVDPAAAAEVEDDSSTWEEGQEVPETGYVDEATGELKRPWCPATRILEHREQERANKEAEEKKKTGKEDPFAPKVKPRLEGFPELPEGTSRLMQKNEGDWDFTLDECEDGSSLELVVDVGRYLDTSLISSDVQPWYIRLLIKGRLLQLNLPVEVRPDAARAQRSAATGRLVITLPKEDVSERAVDVACIRPKQVDELDQQQDVGSGIAAAAAAAPSRRTAGAAAAAAAQQRKGPVITLQSAANRQRKPAAAAAGKQKAGGDFLLKEMRKATVTVAAGDDDSDVPDL